MPLGPGPSPSSNSNVESDTRNQGYSSGPDRLSDSGASSIFPIPINGFPYQKESVAYYRIEAEETSDKISTLEYAVDLPGTALVQYSPSQEYPNWDPKITRSSTTSEKKDTYVRVSTNQGLSWREAPLSLPDQENEVLSVRFIRHPEQPEVDEDSFDPSITDSDPDTTDYDWKTSPPEDTSADGEDPDPIWVTYALINTVDNTLVQNDADTPAETWATPKKSVPETWIDITDEGESYSAAKRRWTVSEDFDDYGTRTMTIHWRARSGNSVIRRFHTYDRDNLPEFEGSLYLRGQDLRLELDGDEDVGGYAVALIRGKEDFPDPLTPENRTLIDGQDFLGVNAVNLGNVQPGQTARVTVLAYGRMREEGDLIPVSPGQKKKYILSTPETRPVPQVRFGVGEDQEFYRDHESGRPEMQISFDRGLTWEKSKNIVQESAAEEGETVQAYYFARAFGAPEIEPFSDTPGTAWSDSPPSGDSTLWVTSGPVNQNGKLAGGRWETPYPAVAEVPPILFPPEEAAAQFSDTDGPPWQDEYDSSQDHEYVRLSWNQGVSWRSVHMETPVENPTDENGQVIVENPINLFTRSDGEPTVGDRTTYNGPDATVWKDFPPSGSEDIWMISALADVEEETLVGTNGQWSEPIRLRQIKDVGNLIEFGAGAGGPWSPTFEEESTHYHISTDNAASWSASQPLPDAYFATSDEAPATPTDPTSNADWSETPAFSNAGQKQNESTIVGGQTPTWITRPNGSDGWTAPQKVRRDTTPRGPKSDEVIIQYSKERVSWHDEIRDGDKWMRQRVGQGVWSEPIRIVGEDAEDGEYRSYLFQANSSPVDGPPVNDSIPAWDSTIAYGVEDYVFYDDGSDTTTNYWEAQSENTGVTPTSTAPEWENVPEQRLPAGQKWLDGPSEAKDAKTESRYVWSIAARFKVDSNQVDDIRLTDWSGPYRVTGQDSLQYYMRPTNGRVVKNSDPDVQLPVEIVELYGEERTVITGEGPQIYVNTGTTANPSFTLVSNHFGGVTSDRNPTLTADEIQGNLTLHLRLEGKTVDTLDLADLTDGVSAGYVLSPDGLAVTHYSGRDTDAVKPGSLPLIATFVDSEGTEHQQQVTVNSVENANKNLEVSWSAATSSDADPQSGQVGFTVKSNGATVTPNVKNPRELVFEFTATDPNTEKQTTFSEQVQFTKDDGIYKIKTLDGATLREGGDNLRFEVTRTDGEGTSTVGLTSGGFKLVLRPGGSATEFTGSPATITDSDLNTGPQTLQLQDESGNVLDSITVVKAALGTSSLKVINRNQITQNGSQVGKLTFEVADRYKDSVDTITTRKASGRNLKSGDAFSSDITGTESPPYTETVNLEEKRSSYIEVKVTYTDNQPTTRQTFSFDHDLRPEAKYIVPKGKAEPYLAVVNNQREYESYPAIQYYVSAQGDEDVASFRTVFIHAEGDTSNEEKFVYERKGSVLENVPLHPTKDLLDPSGFILSGATIREDLESGESRNEYTARVKVEAYSDWDPDANGGSGGVAGKKDQNAFDQQVGIEGGAFPEFTPEITRFDANPVHRGGGSALLSVGVNEDAKGFQINWKTFDKDGNLIRTFSDTGGNPSTVVDPGTVQFGAPSPPDSDASNGPGYGWIEVTPIGSPTYTTEDIKGPSERISIGPPKAYNTLFSVTGGSSSTTAVATDSSKPGQLNVEATTSEGGQTYNVNAPQNIGPDASVSFSDVTLSSGTSANEISDSAGTTSSDKLLTENAVETFVQNNTLELAVDIDGDSTDEITALESLTISGDSDNTVATNPSTGEIDLDFSTLARTDRSETFSSNVTVQGNLTVEGTRFEANVETVKINDNLAVINDGESGSGVTAGFAGWEVDRGSLTNYFFGFDDGRDRFVVGEGSLDRQVVATREDDPYADGIPIYNSTKHRFDTEQQGSAGTVNVDQLHGYTGDKYPRKAEGASITGSWTFSDTLFLDGTTLQTAGAGTGFLNSGTIIDSQESWFDDVQIRGTLFAREFEIKKLSVSRGTRIFGPGGGKVKNVDSQSTNSATLDFEERPGIESGDICLIKETNASSGNIASEIRLEATGTGSTVPFNVISRSRPIEAGDDVVVVGSSNSGRDSLLLADPYGPYFDVLDGIEKFSGTPSSGKQTWDSRSAQVRMGLISGASGNISSGKYGLYGNSVRLEDDVVIGELSQFSNDEYIKVQNGSVFISDSVTIGGTNARDIADESYVDAAESAAESAALTYADGIDTGIRDDVNGILENALTNGDTIISGGVIATDLVALTSLNFTPLESSGEEGEIVATINASSEGLTINSGKLDITASDLTINATDVEFSPVESDNVIFAINNSGESASINTGRLDITAGDLNIQSEDVSFGTPPFGDGDITEIKGGTITTNTVLAENIYSETANVSGKLTVGGTLQSSDFSSTDGWKISGTTATFNDGRFRGELIAQTGEISSLNVTGQLNFLDESSQIKLGTGSDAFFVGDFDLSGSGAGSSTLFGAEGSVSASFQGETDTASPSDNFGYDTDIGGSTVTVSVDWNSNFQTGSSLDGFDADTYVRLEVTVNGAFTKTVGSVGGSGTVSISFKANSSASDVDVTCNLTASLGANDTFYDSVSIATTNVEIEYTSQQDFIGPAGIKYRDKFSDPSFEVNAEETSDFGNHLNNAQRVSVQGGSIVLKDAGGNKKVVIHPQGYIDFKQQGSGSTNGGDFPTPPSGWVRLGGESNDRKLARKSGNGSANDF